MTRELVFIHGRSQQHKDPDKLKQHWIDSLQAGLEKNGLTLPIDEDKIHFPYFGNTLAGLVDGVPPSEVAEIIVRGEESAAETEFIRSVVLEVMEEKGITEEQVAGEASAGANVVERGITNWEWVQSVLKAVDKYVPGASSATLAITTRDVYRYLNNPVMRKIIDEGVMKAFTPGVETVVIGHSLGSVVSYNVLHGYGEANDWRIPLYLTVGAPLGVKKIRRSLDPFGHPPCASKWFNAMDERDVVALYSLDERNFGVQPPIENKTDVDNFTENRHGIAGYLSDPEVARRLYDALQA